jgi:hypothetical protein
MGRYYSPQGNFEVWDKKPDGYYTEQEWRELHPEPIHVPTKAEKLADLEAQYEADKAEIKSYLIDAILLDDDDTVGELKQEMAEIEADYKAKREEIEKE